MSTRYTVKIEGKKPVLIIRIFTMKDGEKVEHTLNIEYAEAEAIAKAFNASMKGYDMKTDAEFCLECQEPHSKIAKEVFHPSQHTPTPWIGNSKRNSGGNIIIKGLGGVDVASVFTPTWGYDAPREEAEARANATLIANAPALLDSLKELVGYAKQVSGGRIPGSLSYQLCAAILDQEKIINQAEGK